jgi:hypothetical protein
MRIGCPLLAISILCLTPFAFIAQEVVPYAKDQVKVDWVRGTDFSKYKTYAWGATQQMTPNPHPRVDIEAALQAKGLQEMGMDANPNLIVAFSGGNKLVYDSELPQKSSREGGRPRSRARGSTIEKSGLVGIVRHTH